MKTRICTVIALLSAIFLLACKVDKPANLDPDSYRLSIAMTSPNQVDGDSFPNADSITVTARLQKGNKPAAGELINFSSTLGNLSPLTALTNAEGEATTVIIAPMALGGGSVIASFNTYSATQNFELLGLATPGEVSPRLSLSLLRNGLVVNRFRVTELAQLRAVLTDEAGLPIANQIVNFSTESGELAVATALTSDAGIALVNLSSSTEDLGAAVAIATVNLSDKEFSAQLNYEILSNDASVEDEVIKLGHFDGNNQFVEGQLGMTIAPDSDGDINLSAGGTLGVSLAMVDENNQRVMAPMQVSFTSSCVADERATIGAQVTSINGVANTTYEDVRCGGGEDVIVASVVINSVMVTLSQTISISPESIGSIEFISASPESIVLKGTGGLGNQETSTLTFLVKGVLGNPLAQQPVTFSLNTGVGDLTLSPLTSLTNSAGLVTTKVTAGNVPTVVRVTASMTTASLQEIKTQSDLLSVNTGLPDQDSVSLALSTINPEADGHDGVEVAVTARMADAFNNPAPDGTTINFTAEGGNIIPSCNTVNGVCSVTWTSSEPRVANHRVTILATAVGHETFYDTNGNNTFDADDGGPHEDDSESGYSRFAPQSNGFFDMAEAWRDDNENYEWDQGEIFIDFDNDQVFDQRDGLFNGPQCLGNLCAPSGRKSLNVRKAATLIMSGSEARLTLMSATQTSTSNQNVPHIQNRLVYASNDSGVVNVDQSGTFVLDEGESETFSLAFADWGDPYGQILPAGTTIQVNSDVGSVSGTTTFTVPNSVGTANPNAYGGNNIMFTVTNANSPTEDGDAPAAGLISITVSTPQAAGSSLVLPILVSGS